MIACAARATAFNPDPHTLLTVKEATLVDSRRHRRLASGVHSDSCLKHVTHDDFVDVRSIDSGTFDYRVNHDSTEFGHRYVYKGSAERRDRRSRSSD
jgi:hypothetical protein